MLAEDRGQGGMRGWGGLALAGLLLGGITTADAQGLRQPAQAARPAQANGSTQAKPAPNAKPIVELKRVPVRPTDAVAIVNGEPISRQQLADECVSRKGEEILETMIARRLIEQAMRKNNLEVTAAEIDAEIDRIALSVAGVNREQWLRTLAKERNISPAQYAHDIIYPALALRKLATPRVQITDEDVADAFESEFGEKLVYRLIMTRTAEHAMQVWEELKKNPAGFEHIAMNDPRSIDTSTRSSGGKPINGPLQRHAYPREVTDKIFLQLVDGDPDDKDPSHKPKNGDFTGPIQVTEDAWLIVKREGVIPARPHDKDNPEQVKAMRESILESKVQQHMEVIFSEMMAQASIENKLTGTVKTASQEEIQRVAEKLDSQVQRTAQPATPAANASTPKTTNPVPPVSQAKPSVDPDAPPVGVSAEDLKARAEIEKSLKKPVKDAPAPKK